MRRSKPDARPVNIRETCRDTLKRFPKTMALLAGLSLTGCAHTQTRYVTTYCLTKAQLEQLKTQEPGKVHSELTGDASHDIKPIAGSAVRLRAYADGLLVVLGGCVDPNQ